MRSTPGSLLEERLAAHLEVWTASHPTVAELAAGGPVLDGLDAVTAWGQEETAAGGGPEALLVGEPLASRRQLLPEACLEGVTDVEALWWAELVPGTELVEAVEDLWAEVADDVAGACRPVVEDSPQDDSPDEGLPDGDLPDGDLSDEGMPDGDLPDGDLPADDLPDDDSPDDHLPDDEAPDAVPDAVLLEAVAACERQLAALTARRDALAGVFAARREAEAEQDVADARAATAADGVGRPWATRARSNGPSELAARLGIGDSAADAMAERGLAAIGPQRDVAEAMAAGALGAATGSWLLAELAAVHGTSFAGALEREVTAREESLAALRAQEDAAGGPALTRAELRARAAADREQVEAEAAVAARDHAEQVTDQVRRELLGRATGAEDWPPDGSLDGSPDGAKALARLGEADADAPAPTSRPTAGAGLGPTKRTWKRRLSLAVRRADESAAEARAAKARAACSTQRWNEDDDQAALLLRGPAEVIAQITAAMDARARRRQSDARTAERAAAAEEGRRFDGSALGTLDQHRIAALAEWATAALEISETSGVSGTWYPIARTAASKPSVSLVLPWPVLAGVSSVGAELAGYGPIGAAAALRIAADGLWRRVFADPTTGAAVGVEEGAWRPGTSLAKLVALRWPGSTLPGSTRPVGLGSGAGSSGGQLDHVEPWATDAEGARAAAPRRRPTCSCSPRSSTCSSRPVSTPVLGTDGASPSTGPVPPPTAGHRRGPHRETASCGHRRLVTPTGSPRSDSSTLHPTAMMQAVLAAGRPVGCRRGCTGCSPTSCRRGSGGPATVQHHVAPIHLVGRSTGRTPSSPTSRLTRRSTMRTTVTSSAASTTFLRHDADERMATERADLGRPQGLLPVRRPQASSALRHGRGGLREGADMSSRSRRHSTKRPARRSSAGNTSARIPAQRASRDPRPRQSIFVPNDDALLVLHRATEDPEFQAFVEGLPLVEVVGQFIDWVGDGVTTDDDAPPDDCDLDDEDVDADAGSAVSDGVDLQSRLGVDVLRSSGVARWRSRVVSMACTRWGLIALTEDGIGPGPDVDGWHSADVVERTWVRSLVVAAALECTARYVAAQHLEGDQVRHALATMLASAGEDTAWPLGLMSALRPDDLLSEHVDRVVAEHVAEMGAWGVLAAGDRIRAAPGAEPLLEFLAVGLRADPVPMPTT